MQLAVRDEQLAQQGELLRKVGEKANLEKATIDTMRELAVSKERDLTARLQQVGGVASAGYKGRAR